MALTPEDRLHELELLPAWKARQGLSGAAQASATERLAEAVTETGKSAVIPVHPAAHLDWQTLQQAVSNCQACGLAQTRTQTVFGTGDADADWLFVGEAPGAEEDKRGEPFVGAAGQLLDNMLAAIQLKRGENVYIANVLKCRPPGNRDPHGEEVASCNPYLKRQVELIQPRLIVALGKFAAQALLDSEQTIGAMRGKLHDYNGVPVVVTYHPAYLLRSLSEKAKAWEDLCFARATMRTLLP